MEDKKSKKEKILEASMKIFFREGFHKAKISEIAEEAHIGKGTVYEYFESKEQLFEETAKSYVDNYCRLLTQVIEQEEKPIDKLKSYLAFQKQNAHKFRNFYHLFEKRGETLDKEIFKVIITARNRILRLISNIIEKGIQEGVFRELDPYIAASIFFGSTEQLVFDQMITEESVKYVFNNDEEEFLNILLKGIQKETGN